MLYLDTKYISLVSYKLEKFKKTNTTYNFRCPYCGDSKKNKNRARGYFFPKKGSYIYKCHNCGIGRTVANFLKDQDPELFTQYTLEAYKEGASGKGTKVPTHDFKFKAPVFESADIFSSLEKISDLNKSHVKLINSSVKENYPLSIFTIVQILKNGLTNINKYLRIQVTMNLE